MKKLVLLLVGATLYSMGFAQTPSWMRYPAISPDGSQIAFSYQGDIFLVPTEGGEAKPLTRNDAYDYEPVWSRDGSKIAFASDRYGNFDVFVIDATGGAPKRLTFASSGDHPSDFSPDGSAVIFSASRQDAASNRQFPSRGLRELYRVPVEGGRPIQILTTAAENARFNADGSQILFHDWKGYEDQWRKHHTSSVTRDIWTFDLADGKYTKVSEFKGEDLYPAYSSNGSIYYLSEMYNNNFNVVRRNADGSMTQVSSFENHPVRFLSISNDGLLCYSYHGELYTQRDGAQPQKVAVTLRDDAKENEYEILRASGSYDFSVSPNGKEIAFVDRGEVFVTAVDGSWTKRITNTPEQERSVDFHPDGRKVLYSGERNGSWNVYEAEIANEDEPYFYAATIINEKALLDNDPEEFQATYSPDGKEVAYLEERTTLKVLNIESGETRVVLPGKYNYSYADGDQDYQWSPDGKWFAVTYLPGKQWTSNIGLVSASGEEEPFDLSRSGFEDWMPLWQNNGDVIIWGSNRDGNTNLQGRGGTWDIYAMFTNQAAYDKFQMNEEEYTLWKEKKDDKKDEDEEDDEGDKKDKKKKKKEDDQDKEVDALKIEFEGIHDRKARLTPMSSDLGGGFMSKEGDKIYYFAYTNQSWGLYRWDLYKGEMETVANLGKSFGNWEVSKDGKEVFYSTGGGFAKIALAGGKKESISVDAEIQLDPAGERAYLFEHVWRQVFKKFYVEDLQGVDWAFYKEAYEPKVAEMVNNQDFAELVSEMLGELNASHTGSGAFGGSRSDDNSASLGMLFDWTENEDGLTVTEVLKGGPGDYADSPFKTGSVIKAIDGVEIKKDMNPWSQFNRKSGETVLVTVSNDGKTEDVRLRAISGGMENQLRYKRWVEKNREEMERLSGGKVGYVHVRGMNDASMRVVYEEVLGRYYGEKALIVDTRFNGGGWLHDNLATFLSGKEYVKLVPRGQEIGQEPQTKWKGSSCVLMSESNYSDAHFFPWAYKELEIGPLIGTSVAGTATAVWWETLMNNSMYFGIPMVGTVDKNGNYLENQDLLPDYEVVLGPADAAAGKDPQLEKAVEVMLGTLK